MENTLQMLKTKGIQTPAEEIINSLTHGFGAVLSAAGLAVLITLAAKAGDPWKVVSFSIYGFTLVLLYTMSTLYHAFREPKIKRIFNYLDHSSIYLLIAGTYTPITLTVLRGPLGWTLFGLIWAMAIGGIVLKVFTFGRHKVLSVLLYIAMGWTIIPVIKPVVAAMARESLAWIVAGGVFYTLGTVFYGMKKTPYTHGIWHMFVLFGSISHYFCMLSLI